MLPSFQPLIDNGSELLEAMANEKRLLILCTLVNGEVSVGPLSEMVGLSQSALSQHLRKLRAAKLVDTRRVAQTIYYSCSSSAVARVLEALSEIFEEKTVEKQAA